MNKKIFGFLICMLMISTVVIPTLTAAEVTGGIEKQLVGAELDSDVFGFPTDEEPLTTYGIEVYNRFWDYDRNDWLYRMRLDWYQTKFTDGSVDDWPYVVLETDLTIIESGIVSGSGNSFDFGGWNVEEYAPADYSDVAVAICNMIIGAIPYSGIYFSNGLALAQALDEPQSYPDYEWMGQQIFEADGFFQYDCHIDPDTEFSIKFMLHVWGSSVSGGPGVHNYVIGWKYYGTSPSEPDVELSWTPESHNFGNVKIGKSESKTITLENDGVSPVEVTVGWASGDHSDMTLSGAGTYTLDPNDELDFSVKYSPSDKGEDQGAVKAEVVGINYAVYCSLYGTGTRSYSTCFLAGTQITMADESYKNIEDIIVGDTVKSYNITTREIVNTTVTKVHNHTPDKMTNHYLIINNNIKVTPNHIVFINDTLMRVKHAKVGDIIVGIDGEDTTIDSIEKVFTKVPTYNFEYMPTSNLYITDDMGAYPQKVKIKNPMKPIGKFLIDKGVKYSYSTFTVDIANDKLFYVFDWGDGTDSGWIGPYNSGETVEASHIWTEEGKYNIKVNAKDRYDELSEWSDTLAVAMVK